MQRYRFEHDFDLDPKAYWDMFFDEKYNLELFQQLKITRDVLLFKDEGNTIRREVKAKPSREVPAVFKSVVNDLSYTEKNVFHKDRSEMDVVIEPALMKNKFDFKAVYSVKPNGPGKCKRVFDGDIKVSIMILGGQIEKYMVDELRTSYEVTTKFTHAFIKKMKEQPVT